MLSPEGRLGPPEPGLLDGPYVTPCLDVFVTGGPGAVELLEEVVLGRKGPDEVGIVIPDVSFMVERVVGRSIVTGIDVGGTDAGGSEVKVGGKEMVNVGGSEVGSWPWTSGM